MSIRHLAASASADDIVAAMTEDGAAIVDAWRPRRSWTGRRRKCSRTSRQPVSAAMISRDANAQNGRTNRALGNLPELEMHPVVVSAAEKKLRRMHDFQIHLTQVIANGPGSPARPDSSRPWVFDFFKFPEGSRCNSTRIWAMTDFTAENGATGHSEEPSVRRWFEVREKGHRASRDGSRVQRFSTPAASIAAAAARTRLACGIDLTYSLRGCGRRRTSTCRCLSRSQRLCQSICSG